MLIELAWAIMYAVGAVVVLISAGWVAIRVILRRVNILTLMNKVNMRETLVVFSVVAVAGVIVIYSIQSPAEKYDDRDRILLWCVVLLTALIGTIAVKLTVPRKWAAKSTWGATMFCVCMLALTSIVGTTDRRPTVTPRHSVADIPDRFPSESLDTEEVRQNDCVNVIRLEGVSKLDRLPCGRDSAFRVIQVVKEVRNCIQDSDLMYSPRTGRYALCLDYDWSLDRCLVIKPGDNVRKVECNTPGAERVDFVIADSDSSDQCPRGGFVHKERRYTVCTTSVGG